MSGIKDRISGIGTFIYNSDEGKVLGRDARSWGEIGLFYLIYYTCLAGFFVGMLAVFYQTVDEKRPKLTGSSSLLKGNPGMGFKPMPDVEYTLVRFKVQPKSYSGHVESIAKVMKPYLEMEANGTKFGIDCDDTTILQEGQFCKMNVQGLTTQCNIENNYGYEPVGEGDEQISKACILLRLNKIFDWMPQEYTAENVASVGDEELQAKILANPKMIYIDCKGENPADRDNIQEINYFPQQGFPHYYYPFTNQKGYMAPIVFVQLAKYKKNIALMIECRALAPNINYDRQEKEGGVHFEFLFDP